MKGVEKEMRVQLHLQSLQLRLRKLRFQPQRSEFARLEAPVITEGIRDERNQQIHSHAFAKVPYYKPGHSLKGERLAHCPIPVQPDNYVANCGESDTQQDAERKMNERTPQPVMALNGYPGGQPEYQRGGERPEVTPGHLKVKRVGKQDRTLRSEGCEVVLESKNNTDNGPDAPDNKDPGPTPAPPRYEPRAVFKFLIYLFNH